MLDADASGSGKNKSFDEVSFLGPCKERPKNISRGIANCKDKNYVSLWHCYVRTQIAKWQNWDLNPGLSESSPLHIWPQYLDAVVCLLPAGR